jgi:hypothetical protein
MSNNDEIIKRNIEKLKNHRRKNGRRNKGVIQYEPETPVKSRLQKKLNERRISKLTGKSIQEIRNMYAKHKIDVEDKFKSGEEVKQENILDGWNNAPKLDVIDEGDEKSE